MHKLKSYAVMSLFTGLLAVLPVIVALAGAPAEAIHCEFLEDRCGNNTGGGSGGGGGGGSDGGSGDGPPITFTCPDGYRVYCVYDGNGLNCTCRKESSDGGTP
ncbi:hypothetical protein F0U60_51570 [Archangium minus]|uniref:Lipoprotein n=1 Tax=Archangium minus TaxID=83450 RepID=A0ABY9X8D4_9BACT|nr:hypothetical protein F0U60_51570 [Archangium minus]